MSNEVDAHVVIDILTQKIAKLEKELAVQMALNINLRKDDKHEDSDAN